MHSLEAFGKYVLVVAAGYFYSTTSGGGAQGYGVVFKLSPNGAETVLHSFTGGSDGTVPEAGLIKDTAGSLYGTASQGGANRNTLCSSSGYAGCGTVFRLSPKGKETILYSFCALSNCTDGAVPTAGLIAYNGNLYGTTSLGGSCGGCGTVFKITP